ncbi:unnamed protein product [Mytilus edulis]|uniref:Cadherin domain-containing protein n=1 Tax=Mytilus edulis TaxID=6550 RepID=A0A8S3TWH9_MYTED|nr:unnamed protein product [Mytilus edulis]
MDFLNFVVLFILLVYKFTKVQTYDHVTTCAVSSTIGESVPYDFKDLLDISTGAVYMVEDENFPTTIYLHIWRRLSSNSYELVGFNTVTPTDVGHFEYDVPISERISVKHGDYIGWFTAGSEVISYNEHSSYPIMNRKFTGQTSFTAGDTLDWTTSRNTITNRQYAIGARTASGDTPTLNIGTNYEMTIDESTVVGTAILTLSVVDDDVSDIHTINVLSTDNGYFELNSLALETLQDEIPEATYIMELEVIDECYHTSTSTVTITVQNTVITIDNLPHTLTIREDLYLEEKIYDLIVTEATDIWYCDMLDTNDTPFLTRQEDAGGPSPDYAIYLNPWPQLDYDANNKYLLTVKCYDDHHTASGTATISIIKNTDPVFTNLDNSVTVDALTQVNSDIVFTVSVTDDENDQIIFTMTTSPAGGPFDILDYSGKVVLTENVLRHHASATYDLSITANDGYNTIGPRTLTVNINDINDKPVLSNLPANMNLLENAALSTSLFTVSVDDLDISDPRVFTATFGPRRAAKYFSIDSDGVIWTSAVHNIDYDYIESTSIKTHYSISRDESNESLSFPLTRYHVYDPDVARDGDVHEYFIDCGTNTSRLSINNNTGQISFRDGYDLDIEGTPTDISCIVNVTDIDGLTDTCQIAVNIRYVNEYTPFFPYSPWAPLRQYPVTVYSYDIIGTIIITITATDSDLTEHGTFYYSLVQTFNGSAELFGVLNNGSVYIKSDFSIYDNGATFDVLMLATDTGGLIGTATIQVTIPAPTTTTTTTETPLRYTEDIVNTSLLSFGVVGGIVVILLIGCLLFSYFTLPTCNRPKCNCCKRKPKPPKPKVKTPPLPPPVYTPMEAMPLPRGILLGEPADERVYITGKDPSTKLKSRNNSRDERIYEQTYSNSQGGDPNKWMSTVDKEENINQSAQL